MSEAFKPFCRIGSTSGCPEKEVAGCLRENSHLLTEGFEIPPKPSLKPGEKEQQEEEDELIKAVVMEGYRCARRAMLLIAKEKKIKAPPKRNGNEDGGSE